jgi:hypothetical protein
MSLLSSMSRLAVLHELAMLQKFSEVRVVRKLTFGVSCVSRNRIECAEDRASLGNI